MPFDPSLWIRLSFAGLPVYLRRDRPEWFVPNDSGDEALQALEKDLPPTPAGDRFLARLPDAPAPTYPGRAALLSTDRLPELWFHLTDRCNLTCSHCLFASGPDAGAELDAAVVLDLASEAAGLGCRLFALTGGEPLVHPDFGRIVQGLQALEGARVVVLTNGLLLRRTLEGLEFDRARFHLQVSVDGLAGRHDRIRGKGAFAALERELAWLKGEGMPFTLSMCVERENLSEMTAVVEFAARAGAANVHFLWYFVRGRGSAEEFVPPLEIFPVLERAAERAEALGVRIDNLETLRTQIFAPAGTYHDGSNSGWESVAVGPDARLYPSAALVGTDELATGLDGGLARAWRTGAVLEGMRRETAADLDTPWRFLLGGGDADHSWMSSGRFVGGDPYLPLYEKLALWLIAREAARQPAAGPPRLRLKMGDLLESCGAHGAVALTHANCLLSLADADSRAPVKAFYAEAVGDKKEEILNPICYEEGLISHIPAEYRFRGYGCGSPVLDADIAPGETVVDLGCGGGVECFIAALQAGPEGRVIGVDMLDPMLALAREGAEGVRRNLGYDNLAFRKGYLEDLPLEDGAADLVLSNCVMNLSVDKRRAFGEIFRALRPGGRLVISDVVCESEPDAAIRNDETLKGECIGGALTQKDLIGILEESGFVHLRMVKRFPYRVVRGHPFFSLTFEARRSHLSEVVRAVYRGPFASVVTGGGQVLYPGVVCEIPRADAEALGENLFVIDEGGAVTNLDQGSGCACALPPEAGEASPAAEKGEERHRAGCMVCGEPLEYGTETELACHYCGERKEASAVCERGHFVCDACHAEDAQAVIEDECLRAEETDLLALFARLHELPAVPVHGPEHHALLPGVILSVYRNLGGSISDETIRTGIRRGTRVVGGSCAYWGTCGAATGVGIAFSLILGANPVKGAERQAVQEAVQEVLAEIAKV
ncbi:MAG: methyltransferase type 11, partial [Desulfuromonas sp.]|uniref:DUF5714 domain-containing protein n=1 Tax=Desulfuromonas sp. TaxID=892 RepID=UPI000CB50133